MKKSCFIILFITVCFQFMHSQIIEIKGKVKGIGNIENIHVINVTSNFYAITNKNGEFNVNVKLNDTLKFSSIQYKHVNINIDEDIISKKSIIVQLEEFINELEEVVIGNILTGDLALDMKNSSVKPKINFYDVGILGYKGKPKTQNERRLYEATTGFNKVLNAISGRTKKIKIQIKMDKEKELLKHIESKYLKNFCSSNNLNEDLHIDFLYFCSEDTNFYTQCKDKSDADVFKFLHKKLIKYNENIKINSGN